MLSHNVESTCGLVLLKDDPEDRNPQRLLWFFLAISDVHRIGIISSYKVGLTRDLVCVQMWTKSPELFCDFFSITLRQWFGHSQATAFHLCKVYVFIYDLRLNKHYLPRGIRPNSLLNILCVNLSEQWFPLMIKASFSKSRSFMTTAGYQPNCILKIGPYFFPSSWNVLWRCLFEASMLTLPETKRPVILTKQVLTQKKFFFWCFKL